MYERMRVSVLESLVGKTMNLNRHWHTPTDVHVFKQTFNLKLSDFVDCVGGFDVIKFDKILKVPDGISTRDFITKKYGEAATALIDKFLRIKKEIKIP